MPVGSLSVAFSPDGQRLASANEDGSIHLWETMSVSREIQHRRATNQMVADLFGQMPLRADVLERLRTLPGMSPSRRQEAITVAQTYPEDSSALNNLAWELVKLPGGEMSAIARPCATARKPVSLNPRMANFLSTLGVAYYRVGNYEKALDVLSALGQDQRARRDRLSPREPRLPRHDAPAARPRQGSPGRSFSSCGSG